MTKRNILHHLSRLLLLTVLIGMAMPVFSQKTLNKPPKRQQVQQSGSSKNKAVSISKRSGTINGHDYVDLGLSVKWATCNVGASKPSDYGSYFAWGETSTKSEYTKENSVTWNKSMGDISGDSRYDAARANWGGTWRLPTQAEIEELVNRCTRKWTTYGGHKGSKFTGPNGNSIFFPAAGEIAGREVTIEKMNGFYWNSMPRYNEYANCFSIVDGCTLMGFRMYGLTIRPVSE